MKIRRKDKEIIFYVINLIIQKLKLKDLLRFSSLIVILFIYAQHHNYSSIETIITALGIAVILTTKENEKCIS